MAPRQLPGFSTWASATFVVAGSGAGESSGSGIAHRDLVDPLTRLDAEIAARRASGAFVDGLRQWRTRHRELARFDRPDDLIRLVRSADGEGREPKDQVLAALCVEGAGGDEDAAVLIAWLMLPSLLLVRRSLAARSTLDADELDAELLTGLWEAAARVRSGAPYVAKRLVDGARHRAFAAIRREEDWTGRIVLLQGEIGESQTVPVDSGEVRDVLSEAVTAGVISEVEADLFRASRAAVPRLLSRLGISESAARSRRLRAKRRLLDWLADPSPGLHWASPDSTDTLIMPHRRLPVARSFGPRTPLG